MILVNFAHALTPAHLETVERLTGYAVSEVIHIKTQFDESLPFAEQARAHVDFVGFAPERWQTNQLLINLPGYNYAAALILAELHGRMGYFPTILRLRPVADRTPSQFEVVEILNLQSVRNESRIKR